MSKIWNHSDCWNQGIMSEGIKLIVEDCLNHSDTVRIQANVSIATAFKLKNIILFDVIP